MEQGISKLSLDKGNKLKEGHGGLPRERFLGCVCMGGKKKRGEGSVKNFLSSYVSKNQAWKGCVQKSSMERVCAKIKHGKGVVCSKYL